MLLQNIILTGFMGCGKTTVGKLLAARLKYRFVDTDLLIEQQYQMSIPEIFSTFGEKGFRQAEKQAALELSKKGQQVIATGGKLMLDPDNSKTLGKNGIIFCLIASPEEIFRRISAPKENNRPLLETEEPFQRILKLIEERRPGYRQFHQIDTTGKSPEEVSLIISKLVTQPSASF